MHIYMWVLHFPRKLIFVSSSTAFVQISSLHYIRQYLSANSPYIKHYRHSHINNIQVPPIHLVPYIGSAQYECLNPSPSVKRQRLRADI